MNTKQQNRSAKLGFTLIEMIGVLAVIAILAALLIPKIFDAINNARINNASVSYNSVKSAVADHYAKYGSFLATANGATLTLTNANPYDAVLLSEGFMDKPFAVKIGDGTTNTMIQAVAGVAVAADGSNSAYDLDGAGTNDTGPAGNTVIQAVITGVARADAQALNDRLDGALLGSGANAADADIKGRVKYVATTDPVTVYIYIAHR